MVLDLFSQRAMSSAVTPAHSDFKGRQGSALSTTWLNDTEKQQQASYKSSSMRQSVGAIKTNDDDDFDLFTSCVTQVQRNLKTDSNSPSSLHILASYYTKITPLIENRPFCVSLSYATFLFHMQMARISLSDVELYVKLIETVLSQMSEAERLRHPFVQQVLRDHVLGLSSHTCRGSAHCVVLLPPQQYRAFSSMACNLLELGTFPIDIAYQFQDRLRSYCNSLSPLVANRALALLVQTVDEVQIEEQVTALQYVLKTKPTSINLDFLLACYERLKRAVRDPANGPSFGRALSIHCSELFLRFRSPIRREYVERYLYPSLCHPDMSSFLDIEKTRRHLFKELLSLCTTGLSTTNPFYMCICALLQSRFDDEIDGAVEIVRLIGSQMPHTAYFMSALAVDTHMSVSMFAKVIIALSRGAGLAMTGHDVPDEVASTITESQTNVYNVLFLLREVVRACSVIDSRRATDMLKALRVAVPLKSIEALGKLSTQTFEGHCDIPVDPQLLCAEVAMVLHHEHVVEAIESSVDYFNDVSTHCHYCGMQRSGSLLCPVNGTVHVVGQLSVSRVLSTLAECAGSKVLEERLIHYMRSPITQLNRGVHFLIYHIISNARQHRNTLFVALEPYIRATLLTLVNMERSQSPISSENKANILMLHVKLVALLSSSIDASYLESILKVFAELKLNNNHDALALWYMCNFLLRNCKENIDLLPTDPQENNYCLSFPGCAPISATCADNAQLLLKLLDRAHSFSRETRKLVGCCVCKLIQDFNMQAANIVSALLSSFGFVPVCLDSLSEFALPVGAGSTFWTFFLHQIKSSTPARTSLMVALAKAMARRFRIASPADAVSLHGTETTAHLFSVMVYEAMKRNPPLARVILFMISHWMRQSDHLPGKLVCLVYLCMQLITVILERGDGVSRVEIEAETVQDRMQFHNSVKKATKLLSTQQSRLQKLAPIVQQENDVFFRLIHRLRRKIRCVVASVNGEEDSALDDGENEEETGVSEPIAGVSIGVPEHSRAAAAPQTFENNAVSLNELCNAMDDSVFNDFSDKATSFRESGEEDHLVNHHNAQFSIPSAMPSTVRSNAQGNKKHILLFRQHGVDIIDHRSALRQTSSRDGVTGPLQSTNTEEERPSSVERPIHVGSSSMPASRGICKAPSDTNSRVVTTRLDKSHPNLYPGEQEVVEYGINQDCSRSFGTSPHLRIEQLPMQQGYSDRSLPTYDKATSAPFMKNFGTSPIQFDDALTMEVDPGEFNKVAETPHEKRIDHRESEWVEPDLSEDYERDITPIDKIDLPQLQAAAFSDAADGVVMPSGMVLEYLRTHQAMDSLRHELQQLEQNLISQPLIGHTHSKHGQYAAKNTLPSESSFQQHELTVEGRTNNYAQPHKSSNVAPGHTLVVPVHMVSTTHIRCTGQPPYSAGTLSQQKMTDALVSEDKLCLEQEQNMEEIVDGERPITAVSEDLSAKRVRKENRPHHDLPCTQSSPNEYRGMNFFLKQNKAHQVNVNIALHDLYQIKQQNSHITSLVQKQQNSTRTHKDITCQTNHSSDEAENIPPSPLLHRNVVSECLSPTTPFGQLMIPTCFIEQKNDTAMQELREVMGVHNAKGERLSVKGKRTIRGSGTGDSKDKSNRGGSGAWWTEMSSAPMPSYSVDPQYSMELF